VTFVDIKAVDIIDSKGDSRYTLDIGLCEAACPHIDDTGKNHCDCNHKNGSNNWAHSHFIVFEFVLNNFLFVVSTAAGEGKSADKQAS
jgi:hypothetical protein